MPNLLHKTAKIYAAKNALAWAYDRLSPQARLYAEDYAAFKSAYAPIIGPLPTVTPRHERALIVGIHGFVPSVKLDGLIAKALQARGYPTAVLLRRGQVRARRYYRLFGIREFIWLEDFLVPRRTETHRRAIARFFDEAITVSDLLAFQYKGCEIGKHALSVVARETHAGVLDLGDPQVVARFKAMYLIGMQAADAAHRLFNALPIEACVFNERGYTPYGEVFDVALSRGVGVIHYNGSHRNDALHFKRYSLETRSAHPISLDAASWQKIRVMPLSADQAQQLVDEHYSHYRQGSWYARQELQSGKAILTAQQVRDRLKLDSHKKTAVIFSHILWDATFFYGRGLFDDYATWLIETVRAACRNPSLNWVVKLHPVNVWRLARDGYAGELIEKKLIREHVGPLPEHVTLLEPDSGISTASLFDTIDYGLTVRGTIGMELPMFGIPVVTAGTGRYAGLGFTVDPPTQEAYFNTLAKLQALPPLTDQQVGLARRHAYGVFRLRPLVFHAARFCWSKPGVPNELLPLTEFGVSSAAQLQAAPEMRAIGQWVEQETSADLLGGIPHDA